MKKIILFLSLFIMSCDDISKRMDTLPKPIESGRVVIGRDIIDFTNIDSTLTGDNISYYVGYTRLKCKERNWGGVFESHDAFITPTGRNNILVMLKYSNDGVEMIGQLTFSRNRFLLEERYNENK